MNKSILRNIIDEYNEHFEKNWDEEDYKWIAVKRFDNYYDSTVSDDEYLNMLKKSVVLDNLVSGRNYYPMNRLFEIAEKCPNEIKIVLNELFDESVELVDRIDSYRNSIFELNKKLGLKNEKSGIEYRFISTLLFFKYPEKYSMYKYEEIRDFSNLLEAGFNFNSDQINNIERTYKFMSLIAEYLNEYNPALEKYENKLKDNKYYQDRNNLLFAQNLMWFAARKDYSVNGTDKKEEYYVKNGESFISEYNANPRKKGAKPDYDKKARENRKVGLTGEQYVLDYENSKLKAIDKHAIWASECYGDGLGYDILSYDANGKEIYIEVKATSNGEDTPFYVTATELAFCKQKKDSFFLYRVYKENGDWKITIYNYKQVIDFCKTPSEYVVQKPKKEKK